MGDEIDIEIPPDLAGERLDKALAAAADPALGLSRSRLQALIQDGRVARAGETVLDPRRKVKSGEIFHVAPPPPTPARPVAEPIALDIVYEDAHVVVVDKPPGMATHTAPGHDTGTLVNALLAHCGETLSGIGGEARPGIVHRIDKNTSGLLVVAKTDLAHQGLSRQFAEHSAQRRYLALIWGAPDRADPRLAGLHGVSFEGGWTRIEAPIGRHRTDRKRMAVTSGGRPAVTWFRVIERLGARDKPFAALVECRLETGRTHQIRVHLSHIGHGLVGDPAYGRPRAAPGEAAAAIADFPRQALHAETLGFVHPETGETLEFRRPPPEDLTKLLAALGTKAPPIVV